MPEVTFECEPADVVALDAWAERLGIPRSRLVGDAVRSHLRELERAHPWVEIAVWGPPEDWSDWDEPRAGG